ncbi:MAG: HEAT repeat domain-containing protein [Candidatus Heimdallarchaeota archaeon]|nr:HEAT repeat domain-containing protein [Candidatus Heimdallarchaeota archaeon]
MDKYSREVMIALSSKDYKKAVNKYLLSYDLENWKIFSANYYKLTTFESERIINVLAEKLDFHMILDILSLSEIIGQSVSLSNDLIKLFAQINIEPVENQITTKIEDLLRSPAAEERRIGLLLAGYLDKDEFFSEIEKMSNYDILFEDAYFALGLMTDKKVIELLSTKFIYLSKNQIQREAIAKILAKKGNPLAALWLFKNKGLDESINATKSIYLSRELAWSGIHPHLYLNSDDDFLLPMTIKMINSLAIILPYDVNLISEINLFALVEKLLELQKAEPSLELIKATYSLQIAIEEIYYNIDPYVITQDTREQIVNSWRLIRNYPNEKNLDFIRLKILEHLTNKFEDQDLALKLIRNFSLKEFEDDVLKLAKTKNITIGQEFNLISTLGSIGSQKAVEFIHNRIKERVDFSKRINLSDQINQFQSEIDFYDDFDNEQLRVYSQSFEDIYNWKEEDLEDIFYWNALYNLGKLKDENSLPIFLEALNDYDPKIRLEAINGIRLLKVNPVKVEEKLIALVKKEQFLSVMRDALITLGEINSNKSIELFIKIIFEAFEDGTLEMVGEIEEEIYDDRWEEYTEDFETKQSNMEEVGATHRITTGIASIDKKSRREDFHQWLNKYNSSNNVNLELREDFIEKDLDLSLESDVIDDSELPDYYSLEKNNPIKDALEIAEEEDDDEDDEEWFTELGERFKKITMVESSLESLKTTNAKIPKDEIKDLIEQPIDSELYKDALIILAKQGDLFAANELIGLFDITDYQRAREIITVIHHLENNPLERILTEIKKSPDWIIKEYIKNINQD